MGTVYAICLIVGGVLVLTSVILGGHGDMDADVSVDADIDVSADADFDMDADADIDMDADADGDFDKDAGFDTGIWLPFLSLRFWIFGSAFYGLTGLVLSLLQGPMEIKTLIVHITPILVGLVAGMGSAYFFRALQKQDINSLITPKQLVGQTARVSLPFSSENKGKIQLMLGGERIDMIASTDEDVEFARGEEAFIIQISEGEARVVKMKALEGSSSKTN